MSNSFGDLSGLVASRNPLLRGQPLWERVIRVEAHRNRMVLCAFPLLVFPMAKPPSELQIEEYISYIHTNFLLAPYEALVAGALRHVNLPMERGLMWELIRESFCALRAYDSFIEGLIDELHYRWSAYMGEGEVPMAQISLDPVDVIYYLESHAISPKFIRERVPDARRLLVKTIGLLARAGGENAVLPDFIMCHPSEEGLSPNGWDRASAVVHHIRGNYFRHPTRPIWVPSYITTLTGPFHESACEALADPHPRATLGHILASKNREVGPEMRKWLTTTDEASLPAEPFLLNGDVILESRPNPLAGKRYEDLNWCRQTSSCPQGQAHAGGPVYKQRTRMEAPNEPAIRPDTKARNWEEFNSDTFRFVTGLECRGQQDFVTRHSPLYGLYAWDTELLGPVVDIEWGSVVSASSAVPSYDEVPVGDWKGTYVLNVEARATRRVGFLHKWCSVCRSETGHEGFDSVEKVNRTFIELSDAASGEAPGPSKYWIGIDRVTWTLVLSSCKPRVGVTPIPGTEVEPLLLDGAVRVMTSSGNMKAREYIFTSSGLVPSDHPSSRLELESDAYLGSLVGKNHWRITSTKAQIPDVHRVPDYSRAAVNSKY